MAQAKKKPSMLRCGGCGTTTEAPCDCGVGYMPAGEFAAMAVARSPEKSDRAIAVDTGLARDTVAKARKQLAENSPVDAKRIGLDGKARKKPKLRIVPDHDEMPTQEEVDADFQEVLYDQACLFLEKMTGETRRRYFAHITKDYQDEIH